MVDHSGTEPQQPLETPVLESFEVLIDKARQDVKLAAKEGRAGERINSELSTLRLKANE